MAKKSIYNNVSREKKNNTKTVSIVLGAVIALLVIFIVWCAFTFSDGVGYENTAKDVTMLKIELEQKDYEINELREKVVRLEEQKRQLELDLAAKEQALKADGSEEVSNQTENIAQ
ncbi:MAG: hypothetical protein E7410_00990 [Ruminococcaceae bacterium]|nr:hypothetical protein [Oscillospiraceae bacterium]